MELFVRHFLSFAYCFAMLLSFFNRWKTFPFTIIIWSMGMIINHTGSQSTYDFGYPIHRYHCSDLCKDQRMDYPLRQTVIILWRWWPVVGIHLLLTLTISSVMILCVVMWWWTIIRIHLLDAMAISSTIIGIMQVGSAVHVASTPSATAFWCLLAVATSLFAVSPGSVLGCAIQHHQGVPILFGEVLLVEAVEIA